MAFNVVNYTVAGIAVNAAPGNIVWVNLPAPILGQIVRVIVAQTSGTVDGTSTLIDFYNAAAAGYTAYKANPVSPSYPAATLTAQYQIMPQQAVPANSSILALFISQFYSNADVDNVNRGYNGLYVRINTQEATSKTFSITITVETDQN